MNLRQLDWFWCLEDVSPKGFFSSEKQWLESPIYLTTKVEKNVGDGPEGALDPPG